MNRIELVDKSLCTACGACMYVCPTKSITLKEDKFGSLYPEICRATCINCGMCKRKCHVDNNQLNQNKPHKAYVGWNLDERLRKNSASGGIAAALYSYGLKNNYRCFGVVYSRENGANYQEIISKKDIYMVQNSKYVYSDIFNIFESVLNYLKQGETVIIPALPCQAAALKLLAGEYVTNLYLIDIVCHGVCSNTFLDQHIKKIEEKNNTSIDSISFRDPEKGTENFVFSLYKKGKREYCAKVYANDVYQLGYHKALIYRDNCYKCKYAQKIRIGDITISDFTGLGKICEYYGPRTSISCILISTEKGQHLINELVSCGMIECHERPTDEAFIFEKQLIRPSIPYKKRGYFKTEYEKNQDFEKAAKLALRKELFLYFSGIRMAKRIYKKLFCRKATR